MRNQIAWRQLALTLLVCTGCARSARPVHSAEAFQVATIRAREAIKEAYRDRSRSKGVIVEVTSPYGTWVEAQGFSDDGNTPMAPDMTFRAGSITKLFTGMAVLQMLQERGIPVTRLISDFLPSPSQAVASIWKKITIQELADHTSGLASDESVGRGARTLDGHPWTAVTIAHTARALSDPGKVYRYANVNYAILAMLVEKLTDRSLSDNLRLRFFEPLHLNHTSLSTEPDCHGFEGGRDVTLKDPSWAYAAGNIVSNVHDLSLWVRAMFKGDLISGAGASSLIQTDSQSRFSGFGVQKYSTWWGHTGRIDGFASAAFYNPQLDASIVVVVNRWDGFENDAPEFPILDVVAQSFFTGSPIHPGG